MNLLVRLLDNQEGRILLDGVPIKAHRETPSARTTSASSSRSRSSSRSTVQENIRIADADRSADRVVEVAKIAKIHGDIIGFEKGYDTLVGERGVTLSGGQKQRVAIARMLLKPKPIHRSSTTRFPPSTPRPTSQIRTALENRVEGIDGLHHHPPHHHRQGSRPHLRDRQGHRSPRPERTPNCSPMAGMYKNIWDIQSKIDFQARRR
ncbi:MAG: ATP-binding cassette domain-containing protein [Bacillus subtilis]|nr:ATP-binding cassette domain-containing protein [Bacillus subtilis]